MLLMIYKELCRFLLFLTGFLTASVFYFFFLYRSPSLSLCTSFGAASSNIDQVLSIKPSANAFVLGAFNAHHKDLLTYSGRTDRPGEFCYNFSVSNDLTEMVNFLNWISHHHSHSPALSDLFLYFHWEILITLFSQFPLTLCFTIFLFHFIAYEYSREVWDDLRDYLRDVPRKDIFKLSTSAAASECCEWVQVEIDVYTLHCKHQVKFQSSPWFSAAPIISMVFTFFLCTNRINLLNPK